jgi:hypothetical protein
MAKAVLGPPAPATLPAPSHRLRTSAVTALLAFGVLVIVGALGVDWGEEPAMVCGELMGFVAPLAFAVLAALIIYRIWKRASAR